MKINPAMTALVGGMLLIGTTAGVLRQIDQHRRLDEPGLLMAAEVVFNEQGGIVNTNTVALPRQVLGYESTNAPITMMELGWLPGDTTYARKIYYRSNSYPLQVNVVMMGLDRTSIHKPQYCLVGQGWQVLSEGADTIALADGPAPPLPVWKMIAQQPRTLADGSQQLVKAVYVYWFVADGHITAQHEQRMWWMAKELLTTGTLQRWAYVSVLAQCLPGQEEATYAQIKEFIAASTPQYHLFSEHTMFGGAD
jgi:hypothetical protein